MEKTGGETHWTPFPAQHYFLGESFTGGILWALLTAAGNAVMEEKKFNLKMSIDFLLIIPLEFWTCVTWVHFGGF